MGKFNTDIEDIEFNLFDLLKVQENNDSLGESEIKEIISQMNKFLGQEIFPTREPGDHEGVKLTDKGVTVPECLKNPHKAFYENGWFGLGFPEKWGGMPVPETVNVLSSSLLCAANVAYSMYPGLCSSAVRCILEVGSEDQLKKYVPSMMEGKWGGTMCLTEPNAGSDVGALKTIATPLDNGKYKIKGVKIFISSGESDLYENNIHLVLARTPGAPEGTKGISLFVVPRYRINDDGSSGDSNDVKCTKIEEKMGIHCSATCEMTFGENDSCEGELIGKEMEGMANMFIMMNEARLLCGVQGEAQAHMAYEFSLEYAKQRSQFGTEIIHHPDVKRMLLKMRAMSRGLRALCLYTANLFDLEDQQPGSAINEINLLTPVCKAFCSDEGFNISVDAIQVHGGYGYCTEYGVEQFARDAKIATIYEGTNGIQAIDFIGRKILKDQGKTFLAIGAKMSETLKSDEARFFEEERKLIIENQYKAEEIFMKFGGLAKAKKMEEIFLHATDFLTFCGNLMVAWRLLESACEAHRQLESDNNLPDDRKRFLDSKIIDFKVFCAHYLTRNRGIASTILDFSHNLPAVELV